MTEQEWMKCTEPRSMVDALQGQVTERKARLFTVACCRRVWHLMRDERTRRAVEVAERFAERQASDEELRLAAAAAYDVWNEWLGGDEDLPKAVTDAVSAACCAASSRSADDLYEADSCSDILCGIASYQGEESREKAALASLHRCIFGNPFRPVAVDPAWLSWSGGTVVRLAEVAYDERHLPDGTLDPARLAVLADALEEAGCGDADILNHLRGPGPHTRGCWPVDALLGRT